MYTGESSVFVKCEVDSNDITESVCSHDDQPMTGRLTSTDSLFISAVCILCLMFSENGSHCVTSPFGLVFRSVQSLD